MEEKGKIYTDKEITKKVIDFCLGKYKFIFISGNGGSGKTTLAKHLVEEVESRGFSANCIDMDDFMINSEIRKNIKKEWIDADGNKQIGYLGWAFKEAYHLDQLEEVINSIINGKDSIYKPKRSSEIITIKADFPLTIVEGVGTAFLKKEKETFGIFVMCDFKSEVDRRIKRSRDGEENLLRQEVESKAVERNEQFKTTILLEKDKFDLELFSQYDHSFIVGKDNLNLIN